MRKEGESENVRKPFSKENPSVLRTKLLWFRTRSPSGLSQLDPPGPRPTVRMVDLPQKCAGQHVLLLVSATRPRKFKHTTCHVSRKQLPLSSQVLRRPCPPPRFPGFQLSAAFHKIKNHKRLRSKMVVGRGGSQVPLSKYGPYVKGGFGQMDVNSIYGHESSVYVCCSFQFRQPAGINTWSHISHQRRDHFSSPRCVHTGFTTLKALIFIRFHVFWCFVTGPYTTLPFLGVLLEMIDTLAGIRLEPFGFHFNARSKSKAQRMAQHCIQPVSGF